MSIKQGGRGFILMSAMFPRQNLKLPTLVVSGLIVSVSDMETVMTLDSGEGTVMIRNEHVYEDAETAAKAGHTILDEILLDVMEAREGLST